jgi:hypothetical protein
MDPREQRALIIAAMCKIDRKNGQWAVPSQSEPSKNYTVTLDGEKGSCNCPDHEKGFCCKHVRAVRITLKRELGLNGDITETKSVTFEEKKTYRQVWPAYNQAQTTEKKRLQVLLQDICRNLSEPARDGKPGPKPHSVKDAIFAMAFKVYCGFSARRFSCDLADAHRDGYLSRHIPGMKVSSFFENANFTPILTSLIEQSAAPLAVVDESFAVDSSGFSSSRFETWIDHKYGIERRKAMWVKVHIACGVKTNVVTAVRILDKDAADYPQFKPLLETTRERFDVKEASADKAYLGTENVDDVYEHGGTPFILPKVNTTGGVGGLFGKMFSYFQYRQKDFLDHYHKRSNVESTFSAVKRKFGDSVRNKTDIAMKNEVLCKILCHNLSCLIQEQCELGIEPIFWPEEGAAKATTTAPSSAPTVVVAPAAQLALTAPCRAIRQLGVAAEWD